MAEKFARNHIPDRAAICGPGEEASILTVLFDAYSGFVGGAKTATQLICELRI